MEGFKTVSADREPLKRVDENFVGDVLLRFYGGVGDVLMGFGGAVSGLNKSCRITAGCNPWQMSLVSQIGGIHKVVPWKDSKSPAFEAGFDAVLDLALLVETTKLPDEDYYSIFRRSVGVTASPASFTFNHNPSLRSGREVVAIHPSASAPNRRWLSDRWDELVARLVGSGYAVIWLGTADEYGFNAEHVSKLSDLDSDLLWQSEQLACSHFFIGTDSGFAHVAGMLGVPGAVIFTATRSRNVISQYRSLSGVEVFYKLGVEPTRSLLADDPASEKVKQSITVDMVLDTLDLDANDCISITKLGAVRYKLKVIDNTEE